MEWLDKCFKFQDFVFHPWRHASSSFIQLISLLSLLSCWACYVCLSGEAVAPKCLEPAFFPGRGRQRLPWCPASWLQIDWHRTDACAKHNFQTKHSTGMNQVEVARCSFVCGRDGKPEALCSVVNYKDNPTARQARNDFIHGRLDADTATMFVAHRL